MKRRQAMDSVVRAKSIDIIMYNTDTCSRNAAVNRRYQHFTKFQQEWQQQQRIGRCVFKRKYTA